MSHEFTPGNVYVGQVLEKLTPKAVSVWLLDHRCQFIAYCTEAAKFAQGDVVFCRLDPSGDFMDRLRPASPGTLIAYADRRII